MEAEDITEYSVADFFCKYTYQYLYIQKNGKIISVLTKDDVPHLKNGLPSLYRSHVVQMSATHEYYDVETVFRKTLGLNRLAILDNNMHLICEYDNGSLPEKARNILKNEMALRYTEFFESDLRTLFLKRKWSSALILGDKEIYREFRKKFFWIKTECSQDYKNVECDVIFNFRYHNKLMHYFCQDRRIVSLHNIMEKIAFERMIQYLTEKNISYFLLRAPVYDRLSCLSPMEENNREHPCSQYELIENDSYMLEFLPDSADLHFLRNSSYLESYAEDNGWIFVQHDNTSYSHSVCGGIRKTVPDIADEKSAVHIYGSCLVYGMFVQDKDTIASLLQKKETCQQRKIYNHGGLLGRNLLNMCMHILSTELHSNNTVILIDIFESVQNDADYQIIDTNAWFNHHKPKNQVWFLDFPLHCNQKANQLTAIPF